MGLRDINITMKNKILIFKKGSSTVELIIIIPIIIAFIFLTWELNNIFLARFKAIESVHYAVWQKTDTRKNIADYLDPNLNQSINNEVMNLSYISGAETNFSIREEKPILTGSFSYQVNKAIKGFGLNTNGKWVSEVIQSYTYGDRLQVTDKLLKGNKFLYKIPMTFKESLITDSWEVRSNESAHNIVYSRVTSGFYEMIGNFMAGIVKSFINFSVMGKKIGPDEPRINLEAVP